MFKSIRQVDRQTQWAAFEAEALPHLSAIFRLGMWLVRDRAEAEDLVQDTFTQALQSFHRYEQGTNCRAWLIRVMFHVNSNRRRAKTRLQLVSETDERIAEMVAFDPPTPQGLTEEDVLGALRGIPTQFGEVVLLADIEDMTYKEIAQALDVPVGTVMSRLHRGRKLMRAALASYANSRGIGGQKTDKPSASSASK
jgi:RNA polymerase sigma-70 factor (ECF subfamily)